MKRLLNCVFLSAMFCTGFSNSMWAQDEPDTVLEGTTIVSPDLSVTAAYISRLPYFNMLTAIVDSSLASPDGNYLAQNLAELQTYHDLGLAYRYINEAFLRKQLGLPDGQGIIITAAEETGEGFKNGFRSGDIVMQVDDESVDTQYDFVIALTKNRGQQRSAKIRRDGTAVDLAVVLSESDVQTPTRWIIGVFVDEISDVTRAQLNIEGGAAITQLTDDGPAIKNGIVVHDIITHINGNLINNLEELKAIVDDSDGNTLTLDLVRMGKKIRLQVEPQEVAAAQNSLWTYHAFTPYQGLLVQGGQTRWTADEMAYHTIVQSEAKPESISDRLDRLETSIKRIATLLKDQLEDSEDE